MSGVARIEKIRTGPATTLPTANGAEIPRNCGSNSPTTIENTVIQHQAPTRPKPSARPRSAGSTAEPAARLQQRPDRRLGEIADHAAWSA
jgi:hypothetical protein